MCSSKKLTEFVVIETNEAVVKHFKGQGQISNKVSVSCITVPVCFLLIVRIYEKYLTDQL